MLTTTLKNVKDKYSEAIQQVVDNGTVLTADSLIELSTKLYKNIQVEGLVPADEDGDMLLFQYGINEEQFHLDITRQFIQEIDGEQEISQLSFTLFYDAKQFNGIKSANCWNFDFKTIDEWVAYLKTMDGYLVSQSLQPKNYFLKFDYV